ncbi:MAG TPA: putative manganese transporter [Candidatus Omnitrophota bacterium]|jgi:hypothetical protein|nr:MAG: hypothetical protein BWY49_00158 [Candidatus Omnitrophica bacterium ADurb.Bin314]HOE69112.1 putative manganese transporter [Candidatus Omnitrophota bacterium]HQB93616.1 putative manganese transporter [Candidatus Omnitrophota bacterium]
MLIEVFSESLRDTLAAVPWLIGIYILLEFVEHRFGDAITERISHRVRVAPFLGALFGCIPQCGFSVIASALYARRCISLGTLLAVFLSTSDEAIPVILADTDQAHLIFDLLGAKLVIATAAGYLIDLLIKTPLHPGTHPVLHDPAVCVEEHRHCSCHSHFCREPWWKTYLLCPVKHTASVALFIFVVSLIIGLVIAGAGEENLGKLFFSGTPFQPLLAVLVGLIPNCAASVAIAEVYLKGAITFGSTIAGLCASAGLGILVLFKELKDRRETFRILGLLALVSLAAGLLLNCFS